MGIKLLRVCDSCGREFELDLKKLFRGRNPVRQMILCSDCIAKEEKERRITDYVAANITRVKIRPKSDFQPDDCLFCENKATQEAVFSVILDVDVKTRVLQVKNSRPRLHIKSQIRCCERPTCVQQAKTLAVRYTYPTPK